MTKLVTILLSVFCSRVFANPNIAPRDEDKELLSAVTNIADVCFGSASEWPDLLLAEHVPSQIFRRIHEGLKNTVYTVARMSSVINSEKFSTQNQSFADLVVKYNDIYVRTRGKPVAVLMYVARVENLESVLENLKIVAWRTWRSKIRYLIIVPRSACNIAVCNNVFRVIWKYWILNAVVLCSPNDTDGINRSKIELYTYNPYSSDHPSEQWKTVLKESVKVQLVTGSFNHSWHVFNRRFDRYLTPDPDCGNLFFDKTRNLDGYVIPISVYIVRPEILLDQSKSGIAKWIGPDGFTIRILIEKLRFNIVEVVNDYSDKYGQFENNSYSGVLKSVFYGQSNLVVSGRHMLHYPGLEMSYPHAITGVCFASRIAGFYPQWTNIFVAKWIWVGLVLGTLIVTLILYLQTKHQGFLSAFLDAERLITGTSVLRSPTLIKYRIAMGLIFLAIVVVDGIFRGRLVSLLAIARRYPDLDNIEQLKEQSVDVYGYAPFKNLLDDPVLKTKYREVLPKDCLAGLERGENQRACLADCLTLPALISNSTIIHQASDLVKAYYAVFTATLNWPLMDRWNSDVHKLVEAGLINKWRIELKRGMEISSWKIKRAAESPHLKPVKPNDLLSAFILLFIGLSIALFGFLLEIRRGKSASLKTRS